MSYGSYENHAINIRRDINKYYKDKLKRAGELDYALRVAYDVMEKSDLVNVSVSYWAWEDSVYIHTYVDSFEEANSLIHSLSTGYGRESKSVPTQDWRKLVPWLGMTMEILKCMFG